MTKNPAASMLPIVERGRGTGQTDDKGVDFGFLLPLFVFISELCNVIEFSQPGPAVKPVLRGTFHIPTNVISQIDTTNISETLPKCDVLNSSLPISKQLIARQN